MAEEHITDAPIELAKAAIRVGDPGDYSNVEYDPTKDPLVTDPTK